VSLQYLVRLGRVRRLGGSHAAQLELTRVALTALTLWPVYLWSVVQQDDVRLFELGNFVTLPVMLVDAAAEAGWPPHIGVETTATVTNDGSRRRRWATTASGLSVCTQLPGSVGARFTVRAALTVPIQTSALGSFVTGTVRRIEMASVSSPERGDPAEPVVSHEQWTLTETPVSPVRFRDPFGRHPSETWDQGILVHLDLFTPRCRCRDIGQLQGREAVSYAQRHLQATAEDIEAETTHYICPDTGAIWIWHRWKRKRYPGDPPGVPHEPMILTRQPSDHDSAVSDRPVTT
jgi:hypothetical protein